MLSSPAAPASGAASAPRGRLFARPAAWLFARPAALLLILAGTLLTLAAAQLAGRHDLQIGSLAERLYLREGFDGLEAGPHGAFRWTHASADLLLPGTGPGSVTARLTLFDAAPAPRSLRVLLDGQEAYRGLTRPGGALWTLTVSGTAMRESPILRILTDPWTPPGDRRALGVALTGFSIDSPDAARRGALAGLALALAVFALAVAVAARTGAAVAPYLTGMSVLGFLGPLLAYGDVWLNRLAPWLLALSLGAATVIWRAPRGRPRRGAALCAAVAVAALLLLFTLGRFNTADAENMFQITAGLAEDGVPWMHKDHTWIKFGLGQPLLTVPLYLLGRVWALAAHADVAQITRFSVALLNAGVIPATALALFLGARRRYSQGVALALAGTFLLATPAVPYARLAFAEPLSGLLLLSAFLLLWATGPRDREAAVRAGESPIPIWAPLLAGLCLGLAVLVKPANAIYMPAPELYLTWALIWRARRTAAVERGAFRPPALRRAVAGLALFAAGLAPGLLLTGLYNFVRYHNVFIFGYEQEGFTTPLPLGLYGLLASPGKGLIFFAPPVLLAPFALWAMWRQGGRFQHAEATCIAAQAAITLVFHALWSSWEGNIAWGPRLILPLVPLLLWPLGALASSVWARRAWAALAGLGFLVALPGALVDQYYYFDVNGVYGAGTAAEAHMLFTPEWSQIVAQWRFLLTGTREAIMRPTLESMGLAAGWDTALPLAFVVVALGALTVGALRAGREEAAAQTGAGAEPT